MFEVTGRDSSFKIFKIINFFKIIFRHFTIVLVLVLTFVVVRGGMDKMGRLFSTSSGHCQV